MTENRVIYTADELDALPNKTIIMDKEGTPYQKHDDGFEGDWWGPYGNEEWSNEVMGLGPVTVLHEPEEPRPALPTVSGSRIKITYHGGFNRVYDEVILIQDENRAGRRVWRIIKQDGRWGAFGWLQAGADSDWDTDPSYSWELLFDAGAANDD